MVNLDRIEVVSLSGICIIEFLTSKNESNIYKKLRNPLYGSPQNVKEDLIYVRKYFEELQLEEIVKMINNEIVQSV